jgi:hypothetical protein
MLKWIVVEIVDGKNIAKHRERMGDEFVDAVLETSASFIREGGTT